MKAGFVAVLGIGSLCQALAADPPASPSSPQPAPPAAESPSATAPPAQQNAAPPAAESTPAKPGITVIGTKPELSPLDKEILSRGYKLEMRHGEKYFCRMESDIESRFQKKTCNTAESIEAQRLSSQDALRAIQNDRPSSGR